MARYNDRALPEMWAGWKVSNNRLTGGTGPARCANHDNKLAQSHSLFVDSYRPAIWTQSSLPHCHGVRYILQTHFLSKLYLRFPRTQSQVAPYDGPSLAQLEWLAFVYQNNWVLSLQFHYVVWLDLEGTRFSYTIHDYALTYQLPSQ